MTVFIKTSGPTASNKPEEVEKLPHQEIAYRAPWHNKNIITVSKPVPDTFSIVVEVPQNKQDDLTLRLWSLASLQKSHFQICSNKKYHQLKGGAYRKSVELVPPVSKQSSECLFQFDPKQKKGKKKPRFLRLEFSPSNLGAAGISFLKYTLDSEFDDLLPYEVLHSAAVVTRLDIAVDIAGLPREAALFKWPGIGKTHLYQGLSGALETLYFIKLTKSGNLAKSSQLKAYDKKKQLEDSSAGPSGGATSATRIELTKIAKDLKFSNLASLPNPLGGITVRIPPPTVPKAVVEATGDKDDHWRLFTACAARAGVEYALSLLGAKRRLAYSKALDLTAVDIWKPEKLWSDWSDSLKRLGL